MALTIAQLISAAGNSICAAEGKNYRFSEVREVPDRPAYYVYLIDQDSGEKVPIIWGHVDETRLNTMMDKIEFLAQMLHNAIDCMDMLLEEQSGRR